MAWTNRAPGTAPASSPLPGTDSERWTNRPQGQASRLAQVTGDAENIILLRKYPSMRGAQAIQQFVFPVNPESIRLSMRRETLDVSLLRHGTLARPGATTPIEMSFDAFLPRKENLSEHIPWINVPHERLPDPWTAVMELRGWQNASNQRSGLSPLLLILLDTPFHLWCAMTSFEVETRPREVGDVYFSVSFREVGNLPRIMRKQAPKTTPSRVDARQRAGSVESKATDNLARISKRVYGVADKAHIDALYAVNKQAVGNDRLKTIPAGKTIVLPNLARIAA